MIVLSKSTGETKRIAEVVSKFCKPGDVLCLEGNLGAGKTQFAKGFAQGLGISEHVTSPTFTLINEYDGTIPLYHIDAYRLEDPDEAYELGLDEYLYGIGVTLIEWPSQIIDFLPHNYLSVVIDKEDNNDEYRRISFRGQGERYVRLVRELEQELKTECTF